MGTGVVMTEVAFMKKKELNIDFKSISNNINIDYLGGMAKAAVDSLKTTFNSLVQEVHHQHNFSEVNPAKSPAAPSPGSSNMDT